MCRSREIEMCHFREIKMCRSPDIEMCHFWEIEMCCSLDIKILQFSGDLNLSCSRDWNVQFSGDWIVSFSEIEICHFRDITILQFSGDWNLSFREINLFSEDWTWHFRGTEMWRFREMKKLNCPVSGKLNPSFYSAEFTRIRRTENLNLKQSVNQSIPEVLPMLTGFVMRYNQPASVFLE